MTDTKCIRIAVFNEWELRRFEVGIELKELCVHSWVQCFELRHVLVKDRTVLVQEPLDKSFCCPKLLLVEKPCHAVDEYRLVRF